MGKSRVASRAVHKIGVGTFPGVGIFSACSITPDAEFEGRSVTHDNFALDKQVNGEDDAGAVLKRWVGGGACLREVAIS
jgi:hypothetical protein